MTFYNFALPHILFLEFTIPCKNHLLVIVYIAFVYFYF